MTRAALALAVLLADGCQQPVDSAVQNAKNQPTADAVFRFLTANCWRTNRPGRSQEPGQPDFHVIMLSPDGRWTSRHVTDYDIPPQTGRWNLQPNQAGNWFLCRDNGQRQQVIMNADGTLTLTAMRLYP